MISEPPYGVRPFATPYFDIVRLRETKKGIHTLADAGYDVQKYLNRLDRKYTLRTERHARTRTRSRLSKPFIAWDGEGWTDNDGEHRYMYMANSLGQYIEAPQLATRDCLDFLARVGAEYPDAIHVIYGGGYDVTHWLRDMHYQWRDTLVDFGEVAWNNYRLKYVPNKWFTLSTRVDDQKVSITIWDVMTFYQSSFIKALSSRGLSVPDDVVAGKAGRNTFTYDDLDFIHTYTGHELRLLVELCETLRSEFADADIPLEKYHGPGAVANAVMKQKRISMHKREETFETEMLCRKAYFGGRFEPFQVGHHDGPVFQADKRSAYPHNIAQLPSLRDSWWEKVDSYVPGEIGIYRCTYHHDNIMKPHPIPWRAHTGAVGFPSHVDEVWLWNWEAVHATTHEGYILHCPHGDEKPFDFVREHYQTRQEWKALGRGGQWALKLAMNSLYGKMAQRTGSHEGPPKYHQLAWAGMVTSMTRAQLWDAISLDPASVIAVETDSVTSTRRLDGLTYSTQLGDWELEEYDWITYLQSGVYWTNKGRNLKIKTRGISAGELTHDKVLEYLAGDQSKPLVTSIRRFIGITNPQRQHYGQWIDIPRDVALSTGGKRIHMPAECESCRQELTLDTALHECIPNMSLGHGPSTPHSLPWRDSDYDYQDDDTLDNYEEIE